MYEDKTLICKECGAEFVFTAGEQEFYAEKGFTNEPQRCKACRDARKGAREGGSGREMFPQERERREQRHPRDVRRCLRRVRQALQGSLPAQGGSPGVLQRVLCSQKINLI